MKMMVHGVPSLHGIDGWEMVKERAMFGINGPPLLLF
jgi:hypothetical protein